MYRLTQRSVARVNFVRGIRGGAKQTGSLAVFSAVESLETRALFCAIPHAEGQHIDTPEKLAAYLASMTPKGVIENHKADWYEPVGTVVLPGTGLTTTASRGLSGGGAGNIPGVGLQIEPISIKVNAAGLPLLSSRPDGQGLKVFLDFDGYGSDTPFSMDSDGSTFNAAEQQVIYDTWRDITSFFSMLNVNITTVQPPTGGNNPTFVWHRISNSIQGGAAYVGWVTNNSSNSWTGSENAISRHSGIAHEIGHQLNLQHQSDYSNLGVKTAEYSSGYDARHGPIMGVDYAQWVHKWQNGRNAIAADTIQDDLATMATFIASRVGGNGYMPDDYLGTTFADATALPRFNGTFSAKGTIERETDVDVFSFTTTGGTFNINVEPLYESALAPKIELYSSAGLLLAARGDTAQRGGNDNASVEFNIDLPAGKYYVKVASQGDYGDVGEYAFYASPLPEGWATTDVRNAGTGRGGYVAYNPDTGVFLQGGSGADIGSTTDAFRFTYQVLRGNGSITARVTDLTNTNSQAKAGLMVRENLTHNSKFALINLRPASGGQTITRANNGSSVSGTNISATAGAYLRITRSGNTITYAQSSDGVSFTTVGTATLTSLANQVYIGLVTNSHNVDSLAVARFTNVQVTGNLGAPAASFNALPAPTGLVASVAPGNSSVINLAWNDVAGETGYGIDRSVDGVNWTRVASTGANVTTFSQNPGFGSMRWWYRVTALDGSGNSAYSQPVAILNKPQAPTNVQAIAVGGNRLSLSWRDVSGESGYRIERSTDGVNFSFITTLPANINTFNNSGLALDTTYTYRVTPLSVVGDGVPVVFAAATNLPTVGGVTFTSKTPTSLSISWTDIANETGYRVERSLDRSEWTTVANLGANVTSFTDTSVSALNHYYYRVYAVTTSRQSSGASTILTSTPAATANPSPWVDVDINSPAGAGAGLLSGTSATVLGGGSDIGNNADQFNFLYRPLVGNGEIIARVTALDAINNGTKAGVMIRESLAANSRYAAVVFQSTEGGAGTDYNYRSNTGGGTTILNGPAGAQYVRLVRSGNSFTGYYSTSSASGPWTSLGTVTINMSANALVGLAASARDNNYITKATFSNISVTGAAARGATAVNGARPTEPRELTLAGVVAPAGQPGTRAGSLFGAEPVAFWDEPAEELALVGVGI